MKPSRGTKYSGCRGTCRDRCGTRAPRPRRSGARCCDQIRLQHVRCLGLRDARSQDRLTQHERRRSARCANYRTDAPASTHGVTSVTHRHRCERASAAGSPPASRTVRALLPENPEKSPDTCPRERRQIGEQRQRHRAHAVRGGCACGSGASSGAGSDAAAGCAPDSRCGATSDASVTSKRSLDSTASKAPPSIWLRRRCS